MIGYLVVLVAISGLASGAPQNWPYRDSLMPYRYGYPNQQAQYKYLPQIEDDEDVGPYFQPQPKGRQEFVVGSDGDRVIPTLPPPSVVETGSVAPVVEQNRIPTTAVPPPTKAPTPPPPKPQGAAPNKPVQPVRPAFPPARPPPPPKREKVVEEDEDEDEDDDESEEGDDDADDQQDDGDDDDNDDEEEEDDRRRQEPISKEEPEKVAEVVKVVEKKEKKKEKVQSNKPEKVEKKQQQQSSQNEPPAPVVVPAPKPNDNHKSVVKSQQSVKTKVPTTSAVDDNEDKPVVDSNEVVKPNGEADDESSEEQGLDDGVEALVPGYVTEQGEILVPVDTVTGNQPISIVPDPYSPPTRGVPLRQHQQRPTYRTPYEYYYPEVYPGLGRQVPQKLEDSDEVQDDDNSSAPEMDDSTETSAAESDEQTTNSKPGRNEFLTAFPPSRSPEFYAVIKSRFPSSSSEEQYESMPQGYPGQVPFRPVQFRRRPQQQSQGQQVAVAVSLSNSNEVQSQQQFVRRPSYPSPMPYPVYSGANRFPGPYSAPYLRNPYGYYKVPVYRPQHPPSPYALQQSQRRPVPPVNPFYARPPQGFRPRPVYKKPPVNYNQYNYNYGGFGASSGQFTPVLIRKNPHNGGFGGPLKKPVSYSKRPVNKPVRKPTPVTYQDDEPYPFVQPMNPNYYPSYPYDYQDDGVSGSDENNSSQQFDSSSVESPKIIQGGTTRTTGSRGTTTKNRRAAKMTKSKFDKKEKKESMKQKKVSDPDPLNILKKISTKRS